MTYLYVLLSATFSTQGISSLSLSNYAFQVLKKSSSASSIIDISLEAARTASANFCYRVGALVGDRPCASTIFRLLFRTSVGATEPLFASTPGLNLIRGVRSSAPANEKDFRTS